jgi:Uma2 family endonuclease
MASDPHQRLLTAREFLRIDFGGDIKAELDNGVIRMMAGGTRDHGRVQMNLYRFLGAVLRGSGCRPFGSDMAIETCEHSVRYPDLTVDCGAPDSDRDDRVLRDPRVVIEVLSASTRRCDELVKLAEYRELPTVETIVLVDPDAERCRVLQRIGPHAWTDVSYPHPTTLDLPGLGIAIPHEEMFARD